MKNKNKICIIISAILLVTLIIVLLPKGGKKEEKKINSIKRLSFYYTEGYSINSEVKYTINCEKTCVATIKPYGESDQKEIVLDNEGIDKLVNILSQYNVVEWDGFNKYEKDVLDGDSFSFNLITEDGIVVNATGYMMWPDNYKNVKKEVDEYFNNILNNL